jgi:CBS domain containing-hemolysin-like protein
MDTGTLFRLLLVLGLLAANAFFVVAEFALVRVRATRLRELAHRKIAAANVALRLVGNLDGVLSAVQLGITMASLGLGWVGEAAVASLLLPLFLPFLPSAESALGMAHTAALSIAFLIITVLHIVLGELVPKGLALAKTDRVTLVIARPMELFVHLSYPFTRLMDVGANRILRAMGGSAVPHGYVHSAEELKMMIAAGRDSGLVPASQEAMIRRLFDLDSVLVREVMVPRKDIVSVPLQISLDDLLRLVTDSNYSRIPVYEDSPEKIIGWFLAKDLFNVWARGGGASGFSLRPLLRQPLFVPETKPLNELLEEFRKRRRQMALVVDEFGQIAGLVTIEDLLEAVVGEIEDELDVEERPRMAPTDRSVELDGATTLRDLENLYGIPLPREHGFETLAGFVLWRFEHLPQTGERLDFQNWRFTVIEMDRRRVARVRIEKVAA